MFRRPGPPGCRPVVQLFGLRRAAGRNLEPSAGSPPAADSTAAVIVRRVALMLARSPSCLTARIAAPRSDRPQANPQFSHLRCVLESHMLGRNTMTPGWCIQPSIQGHRFMLDPADEFKAADPITPSSARKR